MNNFRIPPQDLEAEAAAVGAMIESPAALEAGLQLIGDDTEIFYKSSHRTIVRAMKQLYNEHILVELVSLSGLLRNKGELESCGGSAVIAGYTATAIPGNITYYINQVKRKAVDRALIAVAHELSEQAYSGESDAGRVIRELQDKAARIAKGLTAEKSWTIVADELHPHMERIEERYQSAKEKKLMGVSSGLIDLDKILGGFRKKNLIILAARPSHGKSALIVNILLSCAKNNIKTGLFMLESNVSDTMDRIYSIQSGVNGNRIRNGWMQESDWPKLTAAAGVLSDIAPMLINDVGGLNLSQIETISYKWVKEGVELIALDHIHLGDGGKAESRNIEIGNFSRGIKNLAKKLNIPIIAVAQLSRSLEHRKNKRPILSDLRDSGSLEENADVVAFLYRDECYNKNNDEIQRIAEIDIAKHREGPTGVIKAVFIKECMRFENLVLPSQEELFS